MGGKSSASTSSSASQVTKQLGIEGSEIGSGTIVLGEGTIDYVNNLSPEVLDTITQVTTLAKHTTDTSADISKTAIEQSYNTQGKALELAGDLFSKSLANANNALSAVQTRFERGEQSSLADTSESVIKPVLYAGVALAAVVLLTRKG